METKPRCDLRVDLVHPWQGVRDDELVHRGLDCIDHVRAARDHAAARSSRAAEPELDDERVALARDRSVDPRRAGPRRGACLVARAGLGERIEREALGRLAREAEELGWG